VRAPVVGVAATYGGSWNADKQSACHDLCKQTLGDVLPGVVPLLGGIVFVLIDDSVLSLAAAPPPQRGAADARRARSTLALAPTLAPTSGGVATACSGRSKGRHARIGPTLQDIGRAAPRLCAQSPGDRPDPSW
jgi:hypothetical protein